MSLEAYEAAMERLAKRHAPFKVQVPEGQSGQWRVTRFTAETDLEAMRAWRDGRPVPPGVYTRLEQVGGTGLFMSDTPAEFFRTTASPQPALAYGRASYAVSALRVLLTYRIVAACCASSPCPRQSISWPDRGGGCDEPPQPIRTSPPARRRPRHARNLGHVGARNVEAVMVRDAQPIHLDAFTCPDCDREMWSCRCNEAPTYQGADPSFYTTKGAKR